jgi:hypothetical protein
VHGFKQDSERPVHVCLLGRVICAFANVRLNLSSQYNITAISRVHVLAWCLCLF